MIPPRRAGSAVALAVALLVPGCALRGIALREDDRVDITSPDDRAAVTLPLTIRWETTDLDPPSEGGPYFAVFVDRTPIGPGQSLAVLADDTCDRTPGCPDLAYLRERNVLVTEQTSVTVDVVPRRSGQRTGGDDRHEATIVLLDADGRRQGESAFTVEFTVEDGS